jgi:hypothetical protein
MGPDANKPSSHWKSLADELGFTWVDDQTELATPPEEEQSSEAPPMTAFTPAEGTQRLSDDEPVPSRIQHDASEDREIHFDADEDLLFSEAPLFHDRLEDVQDPAHAADEAPASPEFISDEPECSVPLVDKSHWRTLISELGLELPPETQVEMVEAAESAEGFVAGHSSAALTELFREEHLEPPELSRFDTETVDDRVHKEEVHGTGLFGAGLFSEDEDQEYVRRRRIASEPQPVTEPQAIESSAPITVASDLEEMTVTGSTEDELSASRKRGRRRTRPWKRLHAGGETGEETSTIGDSGLEDLDEVFEPVASEVPEVVDELFGEPDAELDQISSEPLTDEVAEEEATKRRRRRRRRSRRSERVEDTTAQQAVGESISEDDEDLDEVVVLDEDDLLEEGHEERDVDERSRRRPPVVSKTASRRAPHDDDDDDIERPTHRKIPSWEDAVGIIIEANMATRAKSPGGRRRR